MVDVTARVTPVFPANVYGQQGVTVDKVNGAFYIGYDYDVYWSTKGDLLVRGDANPQALPAGPSTYVLTSNGEGELPTYQPQGALSIPDGSITEPKYATESVSTRAIATGAVTSSELASNSVETVKILDANVTTPKLADGSVSNVKMAPNSVGTSNILDANVTTAKIDDKAVTLAKMADGVTQGELYYIGAGLVPQLLTPGTAGQFLQTAGAGANPLWASGSTPTLPAGSILQTFTANNTANTTLTAQIPFDNTPALITEGSQVLAITVTPASASNTILIDVSATCSHSASGFAMTVAAFRVGQADTIRSQIETSAAGGAIQPYSFFTEDSPATTSAVTYTVRIGPQSGNMAINGQVGVPYGGGGMACSIRVQEVKR